MDGGEPGGGGGMNTRFLWTWDGERQVEDAGMTRERAAVMLRGWRDDPNIRVSRTARHTYRVELEGAGRCAATMVILGA